MQLEDRSQCVTDFGFDQWFAHEGSEGEQARVATHVEGCTRCRVRGELLERERSVFLQKAPTIAANAQWAERSRHARDGGRASTLRPQRTRVWLALSAAVMSTLALALASGLPAHWSAWDRAPSRATGERTKGGEQVAFYVKRGARVFLGASGETVLPGDQLRFTYSSDRPAYLALLGRDRRSASVYFPSGAHAAWVEGGHDQALDFSLELDEQLGDERLLLVLCPTSYALEPLRAELERAGDVSDVSGLAGCRIERIALHKQAAP